MLCKIIHHCLAAQNEMCLQQEVSGSVYINLPVIE